MKQVNEEKHQTFAFDFKESIAIVSEKASF
jgi:hypothetical protein